MLKIQLRPSEMVWLTEYPPLVSYVTVVDPLYCQVFELPLPTADPLTATVYELLFATVICGFACVTGVTGVVADADPVPDSTTMVVSLLLLAPWVPWGSLSLRSQSWFFSQPTTANSTTATVNIFNELFTASSPAFLIVCNSHYIVSYCLIIRSLNNFVKDCWYFTILVE